MPDRSTLGALVVLLLLGGITACDSGGHHASPSGGTAAQNVPPPPVGYPPTEFSVAVPAAVNWAIGGTTPRRPDCAPNQITAEAATRSTPGGVLGVVQLRGVVVKHEHGIAMVCGLPIRRGPAALIGASGRRLPVPRSAGDRIDPPGNIGIELGSGRGIWGFAWLGSYCGPRAHAVEIPLFQADRRWLRVPLHGPQPGCDPTADPSVLVDGVAGAPGQAVQPPRPEYSRLRLTGTIEPGTTKTQLAPIDLTLTATGSAPVTVDPCLNYGGRDWAHALSGGYGDPVAYGELPCIDHVLVVSPGAPLHWTVSNISLEQTPGTGAKPGSPVSVTIGIAGVGQLTLKTIAQ